MGGERERVRDDESGMFFVEGNSGEVHVHAQTRVDLICCIKFVAVGYNYKSEDILIYISEFWVEVYLSTSLVGFEQ